MININIADEQIKEQWNQYVLAHKQSSAYHLFEWKAIIESAMKLKSYYIFASLKGKICGVLPLFLSSSKLFGRYLTSIPFFNYGGIISDNDQTARLLYKEAASIAQSENASHVELRHITKLIQDIPGKTHKVRMVLELDQDPQKIWDGFKSKLRSQIKRPMRENMTAKVAGKDIIDDFYKVFSTNMRDLGTPVWTKNIFANILDHLPHNSSLCVIYHKELPVASGFLITYKDTTEIWTASSLRKYNNLSPNMLLYWSVIEDACKNGYKKFDFGRSSPDSGTYRFKEQWGSKPEVLNWQYWIPEGNKLPEINPHNPKYKFFIFMWQKLPVFLANLIGPPIARNLP